MAGKNHSHVHCLWDELAGFQQWLFCSPRTIGSHWVQPGCDCWDGSLTRGGHWLHLFNELNPATAFSEYLCDLLYIGRNPVRLE